MRKDRTKRVIDYIQQNNIKNTKILLKKCDFFECSPMSLRRTLHKLEQMGYIKLKYGVIDILTYEQYDDYKMIDNIVLDRRLEQISQKAVSLIETNDKVFVTSGKTMHYLVKKINKAVDLLLTNSIEIAYIAINNGFIKKIILIGGIVNKDKKATFGPMCESHLEEIFVDKLFTSCDHVDDENNYYCDDIYESFIIKKMFKNAKKKYMVYDKTKINSKGTVKICSKEIFDEVIVNSI